MHIPLVVSFRNSISHFTPLKRLLLVYHRGVLVVGCVLLCTILRYSHASCSIQFIMNWDWIALRFRECQCKVTIFPEMLMIYFAYVFVPYYTNRRYNLWISAVFINSYQCNVQMSNIPSLLHSCGKSNQGPVVDGNFHCHQVTILG